MAQEIGISGVESRYIMIFEDVYDALDIYERSVYMALRYQADFAQQCAIVKRSVAFLCEHSKVKRSKLFQTLNSLENLGLIRREQPNGLGDKNTYYVAKSLGYFKPPTNIPVQELHTPLQELHGGVQELHTGVQELDTYHYSSHYSFHNSLSITNGESEDSSTSNKKLAKKAPLVPAETLVEVYHQTLPESPRIEIIDNRLESMLKKMQKDWVKVPPNKEPFTIDAFIRYLTTIKNHQSWFLRKYKTEHGNEKINNLRIIARADIIAKFFNKELDSVKVYK